MNEIQIYDLEKKDYPKEKGLVIRSKQVFRCHMCLALTNKVTVSYAWMAGYQAFAGPYCWHYGEAWHQEIASRVIAMHKGGHTREHAQTLAQEIVHLRNQHRQKATNDLCGDYKINTLRALAHYYVAVGERKFVRLNTAIEELVPDAFEGDLLLRMNPDWERTLIDDLL